MCGKNNWAGGIKFRPYPSRYPAFIFYIRIVNTEPDSVSACY